MGSGWRPSNNNRYSKGSTLIMSHLTRSKGWMCFGSQLHESHAASGLVSRPHEICCHDRRVWNTLQYIHNDWLRYAFQISRLSWLISQLRLSGSNLIPSFASCCLLENRPLTDWLKKRSASGPGCCFSTRQRFHSAAEPMDSVTVSCFMSCTMPSNRYSLS
ncbi:hypothetical protein BDV37DRAFT_237017 [Aspergillus pseudonomiae]|uniref:Uncharacterized protein n=1 Tax=Aspergillus pseudonomiae TaxID=1506151 RepID=A0A5N7DS45_9EURO|nr:uncharacterized protein BDV37DRAFT_237017 [Aspergillus pseudonomiae]KAE8409234.1 hypothetical protein BDV37DRAFT_237017 [Aspergillus pseudonomiae]